MNCILCGPPSVDRRFRRPSFIVVLNPQGRHTPPSTQHWSLRRATELST